MEVGPVPYHCSRHHKEFSVLYHNPASMLTCGEALELDHFRWLLGSTDPD